MNSIKNYDIVSCLLVLSLMIIGLVNIYSSTYFNEMNFFSLDNFFGKQLFFFSICIFTFFLCMIPDIKIYFKYGSIIYLLMVFLLIGVLFFGNEVNGVDDKIIQVCDNVIEIPQFGTKHSLNVSISAGIILWDLYIKLYPNLDN